MYTSLCFINSTCSCLILLIKPLFESHFTLYWRRNNWYKSTMFQYTPNCFSAPKLLNNKYHASISWVSLYGQHLALAAAGALLFINFALEWLGNVRFFVEYFYEKPKISSDLILCWAPWISQVQSMKIAFLWAQP